MDIERIQREAQEMATTMIANQGAAAALKQMEFALKFLNSDSLTEPSREFVIRTYFEIERRMKEKSGG